MTETYEEWSKKVQDDYKMSFQEPTHESIRHAHFVDGLSFSTIANRHRRSNEHYLNKNAIERICCE